jgi:hypothetical protein
MRSSEAYKTNVTLYTHPARHVNAKHDDIPTYERIAGMDVNGEQLWSDASQLALENRYSRTDTTARSYRLPPRFAHILGDYFNHFYARPQRHFAISDIVGNREHLSNCYRFATTVHQARAQDFYGAYSAATAVVERNMPHTFYSHIGDVAVIGATGENFYGFRGNHTLHSMVALEEATRDAANSHIQVMALGGNMGLTNIEAMQLYYGTKLPDTTTCYLGAHEQLAVDYTVGERFKRILSNR